MANNIGKAVKQVNKPIDEILKFIQYNFNDTGNASFDDIVQSLELASQYMQPGLDKRKQRETEVIRRKAQELGDRFPGITIISDFEKYNKFDNLIESVSNAVNVENINKLNISGIYKLSDEILYDINTARDWIKSYKDFRLKYSQLLMTNLSYNYLREELLILGKSILGRAIELCPYKTGLLRSSGILIDHGDYITIAFTAPYASYVHENLAIRHPWHIIRSGPYRGMQYDCGGRAKFLEIALQEFFPDRTVWTEIHGYNGVSATIGINQAFLEYRHYN